MANKNFTVKNGLEVGGQEVISSSGAITSAALGGQVLGTSASPSFANITTAGYLRGPASFVIDPAAHGDDTGTVVIAGNLQVDGTQTTINSTTMTVDDLNITLASGAANAAAANGAGITVDITGATNPSLVYGSSNDDWNFNKNLNVTGTVTSTTGFTTAANTRVQASSGMLFLNGPAAIPFEVGAGSEKMRLLSDGLAIGSQSVFTTGGIAKLTVAGILSFGASNSDMSYIRRQSTGNYAWQTYDNNNTGSIQLQPYGGNVGIGTTSPQHKLDTVGTIRHTSNIVSNAVYKAFSIGSNRGINDYGGLNKDYWAIQLATPGASTDGQSSGHAYGALKFSGVSSTDTTLDDVLVLNYNGNVGIGVTNPAGALEVARGSAGYAGIFGAPQGAHRVILFKDNHASPNKYNWLVGAQYNTNNAFEITPSTVVGGYTFNVPAITVLETGKVGIGTSSPTSKLDVDSTAYVNTDSTQAFRFTYNGSPRAMISAYGGEGEFSLYRSSNAKNIYISSYYDSYFNGGNVGIGTDNPLYKLHVSGAGHQRLLVEKTDAGGDVDLQFRSQDDSTQWILFNDTDTGNNSGAIKYVHNTNKMHFRTNDVDNRLVISSDGNVGIGTDNPTDTYSYGKVLDIHGSTGAVTYLRDSDATSNFGFLAYDGGTTNRCVIGGGGSAYLRFISAGNETMSISVNGALHIDNTMSYTGKTWLNEAVGGSTPVGGSNANVNTYQKLRLFVNGDINVNQGRGLHFGDVTDAAPLCIREGKPSQHGTDRDAMEIWGRKQLTLTSSYGSISPGDSSTAGTARSSSFYIKRTGQMGGTWTEVITTPNGGDQTCRVFEDWTGRWVMVGRFASDARTSIQATWGSVSGLSPAVAQSTATAFSSDWGDIYPSEVRIMGCTDVDEYMDTRTIDFVYGNRPSGIHSYTPRQWKHFFAGQTSDGMLANAGGSPRFGFTMGYSYDGKGRWYNPNQHGMGMSDANVTNPIAAYTTPTANAFNWHVAQDAKLLATHYRAFASQDVYQTTGFGADDSVQGFYDSYPTEYTNMGGGTTGGGVHATFSSAVFILLKLNW